MFKRRVMLHFKRENTIFIWLESSKMLHNEQESSLSGSHVLVLKCPRFGDNHCLGDLNAWLRQEIELGPWEHVGLWQPRWRAIDCRVATTSKSAQDSTKREIGLTLTFVEQWDSNPQYQFPRNLVPSRLYNTHIKKQGLLLVS